MASSQVGPDVKGAFAVAVALALLGVAAGGGAVGWLVAPLVVGALVYVVTRAPLRISLFGLMFCGLTLENPAEGFAANYWQSPIYQLGALLLAHMKDTTGVSIMFFSGTDVILGLLLLVARARGNGGPDRIGRIPTPLILHKLAWLSLGGTAFIWLNGLVRGGNFTFSLWQVEKVVYLPIIFYLFSRGLRGPEDAKSIFKIVVIAGLIRACVATYVMRTIKRPPDIFGETDLPYGTTHHDSMLFAAATVMIVALLVHRAVPRKALLWIVPSLGILVMGMAHNGRRMVWVQVALVFGVLFLLIKDNPVKRKVKRWMLAMSPLFAGYVAVGWNQSGGIFKPVETIRSVVEPSTDASSMTREIENYDLIFTLRHNPIFGSGYGIPYLEPIPLPAMPYPLEPYCPHNSILGLWAYGGVIGYTCITLLWCAGVFFGIRAYHASTKPRDRAVALMTFGAVLIYLIQCWGDMGLGSWTGVYLMASALAMAGKLAVHTGAWAAPAKPENAAVPNTSASNIPPAAAPGRA